MGMYHITIEETVSSVFPVEADSPEEALRIAENNYNAEKFVLEPGNLLGVRFSITE